MDTNKLHIDALEFLQRLIATPSFSKEEHETAVLIEQFLQKSGIATNRVGNNVYAFNLHCSAGKPTLLLNSHHDTVKPNKAYTRHPFEPAIEEGRLYGLGSNDAGGCLVALLAAFVYYFPQQNLPFNIVFAASAEEEISGQNGIEKVLPHLGTIDCAIVGEPTLLQLAVAERGLMVIDALAEGVAGHAARNEGVNAIYIALRDIDTISNLRFDKVSELLGETRMSVTVVETDNKQHNVVPPTCRYVIDVRVNECYTFEQILAQVTPLVKSKLTPRSMRLRSTGIPLNHPLVAAGMRLGATCYGSPTTSDKALMPFAALKAGPGDSARSHMADEYIFVEEIRNGIDFYINLIAGYGAALTMN
ncbi:MAG: M20 family metallo-hydrolase [Chitinophagaceae bacterium]|nr:M20 family metallo-hydrolase [Chitinophagaceae bacterium]